MFEVVLQQALDEAEQGGNVRVESAGILKETAGQPANEKAIICMGRANLDLDSHRSQWIGDFADIDDDDIILCMDPEVVAAVQNLKGVSRARIILVNEAEGGIPNPWQMDQSAYDACAAVITKVARSMVGGLIA